MKNLKGLMAGLIIGVLITGGTVGAFAFSESVMAIAGNYKLQFDGKYQTLPDGQAILNYNGRIYTPARFVAETLGAKVGWDDASRTVSIESPEPKVVEKIVEKIVEKEVPAENSENTTESRFMTLPIRYEVDDVRIEIYGSRRFSDETELLISFENKSENRFDLIIPGEFTATDAKGKELDYLYDQARDALVNQSNNNKIDTFITIEQKKDEKRLIKLEVPYVTEVLRNNSKTNGTAIFYINAEDED